MAQAGKNSIDLVMVIGATSRASNMIILTRAVATTSSTVEPLRRSISAWF